LQVYQLSDNLQTSLSTGSFPQKSFWKSVVFTSVHRYQTTQRNNRTDLYPDLFCFNAIFCISKSTCMWRSVSSLSDIQNLIFNLKLIASKPLETPIFCVHCGYTATDSLSHAAISCPLLTNQHIACWISISNFPRS
jgi:hypothetical protein